jgi:hypothetical protein
MAELDPVRIFKRLASDIPARLRQHIIVTGSLAAAYEYRVKLQSQAVNTKDADLIVHPAGNVISAQGMAERLLNLGWRPTAHCFPTPKPSPADRLRAIRLMPPGSSDYFVELLNVPAEGQDEPKRFIPVQLRDGWYGLPSFRYMGVTALFAKVSKEGLEYADPSMMALANLLAHPRIADDEIESGEFTGIRRCAKDLGRVIALAALAGREATAAWVGPWREALATCFPRSSAELARRAGTGLRAMLEDDEVMEQAQRTTEAGLLKGRGHDVAALRAFGERLLVDAIEELGTDQR